MGQENDNIRNDRDLTDIDKGYAAVNGINVADKHMQLKRS